MSDQERGNKMAGPRVGACGRDHVDDTRTCPHECNVTPHPPDAFNYHPPTIGLLQPQF